MHNHPERPTVLCIDDDDGVLGYHRALLERRGYDVLTASSPRLGLQVVAVCAISAVIVDYHMPEMNGHEVAEEIKRIRPHLPVIMVSSDEQISERPLPGVDAFVSKEEAGTRLLPVVTDMCGKKIPPPGER